MPERDHNVILSNNRVNISRNVFLFVGIFSIGGFGLLAWSIMPYLGMIGQALTALLIIACVCGAILALVGAGFGILFFIEEYRRRKLASRLVLHPTVVAYLRDDGQWDHLSAAHETAKLPAPRVPVTEALTEEDRREIERTQVLDLRAEGLGMHKIERLAGVPYNKVREYCNDLEQSQKTRKKYITGDQAEA
jgi:hypothetical protein